MSELVLSNLTIQGHPVGLFEPGQTFDEVTIGTQTWMTKSLAIDDGGEGITVLNSLIVNNVDIGPVYYYDWDAVQRIVSNLNGWHLPTQTEFNTLKSYASNNGNKLKSTYGWRSGDEGTDDYGFAALGTGNYTTTYNRVDNLGSWYYWWSNSSSTMCAIAYNGSMLYTSPSTNYRYQVRLVKDY